MTLHSSFDFASALQPGALFNMCWFGQQFDMCMLLSSQHIDAFHIELFIMQQTFGKRRFKIYRVDSYKIINFTLVEEAI